MSTGRVGIVTIIDHDNFGNRLQNLALQQVLEDFGWEVETIPNAPRPMRRSLMARRALHAIRADGAGVFVRRNARPLIDRLRAERPSRPTASPVPHARRNALRDFTRRHIHEHGAGLDPASLAPRYDRVVVGSDQVWNPGFRQANPIDFLRFAPAEQRVAYAASFGVSDVPQYLRPLYSRWLAQIPQISVREERGATIVRELIERDVPVVVDPTLLVDPSLWHERATVPPSLEERSYVATFFLGGLATPFERIIRSDAARKGHDVVDLLDPEDPALHGMSPLDFVGAIRGARLLATDSFHAGVFALIFRRPTLTRPRHPDDTRLRTLFEHAGIAPTTRQDAPLQESGEVDWDDVEARLALRREQSRGWLEAAVGRPAAGSAA